MVENVHKNCLHFCFLNFSTSYGSRNSIFDIFNHPFRVDFPTSILLHFGKIGLLNQLLRHSWSFRSLKKHSGPLRRAEEHSWGWCHGTIYMCSWVIMEPWSQMLMSNLVVMIPSSWVVSAHGCSWVLMDAYAYSWVFLIRKRLLTWTVLVNNSLLTGTT